MRGRGRADAVAVRLGVGLRDARVTAAMSQAEAATRARISQARWSELERGLGANAPIELWAVVAAAVGVQLAAFLEAVSGANLPRDMEHLRRQSAVVDRAAAGGWSPAPEMPVTRGGTGRVIDVLLTRAPRREAAVVEVWDLLLDVGAAFRSFDEKLAAVQRPPAGLDRLGSLDPPRDEAQPAAWWPSSRPCSRRDSPATEGRCSPRSTGRPARCRPPPPSCGRTRRRRRSRRGGTLVAPGGEGAGRERAAPAAAPIAPAAEPTPAERVTNAPARYTPQPWRSSTSAESSSACSSGSSALTSPTRARPSAAGGPARGGSWASSSAPSRSSRSS